MSIRDHYEGWVSVFAVPGEAAATAQRLIALAGPSRVRAQGHNEFLVPADVADAYLEAMRPAPAPAKRSRSKREGDS